MISTRFMIAAAGLAAFSISAPAIADDDDRGKRHGHYKNDWRGDRNDWRDYARRDRRDDRRDERRAYANGYRDGARQPDYRPDYRYAYNGRQPVYGGGYYGNAGYNRAPAYRSDSYWYGNNGRINCRRGDGTVGVIVGAVAGGTLGNIIAQQGDKRVGSIIGGTLGAILGNELAKGNGYCR